MVMNPKTWKDRHAEIYAQPDYYGSTRRYEHGRQSARINNMYVAMFQRKVTPAPKRSAATNILARTEKPGPFDDLSVFRMSKWEQQKKQSAIEDVW